MIRGAFTGAVSVHGAGGGRPLHDAFVATIDECRGPVGRSLLQGALVALSKSTPIVPDEVPATPTPSRTVPRLVVDAYWQEHVDWPALLKARPAGCEYAGAMLKATQGTAYFTAALRWFEAGCKALLGRPTALGDAPFSVLAYHYLEALSPGAAQAQFHLHTRRAAGMPDSVPVVVDVEKGKDTSRNARASRGQVVECLQAFVDECMRETGVRPWLYGGSWLIDLKISLAETHCRWLWPAAYSATLKSAEYTKLRAKVTDVVAWQYTDGDQSYAVTTKGTRLPRVVPGLGERGALDCSVLIPSCPDAMAAADLLAGRRDAL